MTDERNGPNPDDDELTISRSDAGNEDPTIEGTSPEAFAATEPSSIAGYRIVGKLGQGGMGTVWEAEQERPKRRVALKVMRRDHLIDDFHARMFQREAEILGRLKHPNIASIFESGHTDDGHDYFAMELVRGETLKGWLETRPQRADRKELELRLQLFLVICNAVHYAHQRGVIHRDLKPANIIVAAADESGSRQASGAALPSPKVLDFGLARITDADVAATALSEIGMIKGTLQYMSPEQARGDVDAIDTRTDVYALGVVLYEMLTMRRPIDVESASIAEAVRVICEERPSPLRQNWTGTRKLDVDLETIVGKALDKEADRRYASVAAMADDIERYLASQPIEARPPSAFYQMRKFAARNRAMVGSAAAAVLLLVAFAVTMTVQAERIQREAERANREASTAREVTEFLITLFDRSDPTLAQGEELTARQILDTGAERIEELGDQPPIQAALMETIGRVFTILGEYDRAEPMLDRAVAIRTELARSDELALAESLYHQAALLDNQGRYEEAEEPIRRAVEIQQRTLGEDPVLCQSLNVLGNVLWHQGRLDEAEVVHRQALEIRDRILPPDHTDIGQSLHNLGALRYFDNDLAEAEKMWRRSAEIEKAAHGPNDWNYATSLHTLSIAVRDQGRLDEALELALQSLAIREKALGADHPHVALSLTNLGAIYRQMDRADEAEPMVRRAITVAENSMGPDHPEVFWMRTTLARILVTLERFDDAERELRDQIADIKRAEIESELPPCLGTLADLQARQGRFDESERTYLEAIEILNSADPEDPSAGLLTAGLARVYRDTGRHAEALESFRRALPLMAAGWGTDDPDYLEAAADLAALEDSASSS